MKRLYFLSRRYNFYCYVLLFFLKLNRNIVTFLFFIFESAILKFAQNSDKSNKFLYIYTTNLWQKAFINILKYNSLFLDTFFVEGLVFEGKYSFLNNKLKNQALNVLNLIYIFFLKQFNLKLVFSISSTLNQKIRTISNYFQNAQWPEREMSEMSGIYFFSKQDSRKLLLDYSFIGYPLLKLYPTTGFVELIFSFFNSWLIYVSLQFIAGLILETNFDF